MILPGRPGSYWEPAQAGLLEESPHSTGRDVG
jgi:hypothetical protein